MHRTQTSAERPRAEPRLKTAHQRKTNPPRSNQRRQPHQKPQNRTTTSEHAIVQSAPKRAEKGIRYYSGTAVYQKNFKIKIEGKSSSHWLDIGAVKDLATVTVNGKKLGAIWTAPWRIDISSTLRDGQNAIEIAVANGWANRLIGDEQEPADITWQMGDPVFKGEYFLKEFPEWFLKQEPRPSKGRYTFTTWNYFHNKNEWFTY